MIKKRTFRVDFYFRLCTLNLRLPPLRERGEDVILLAEHFIDGITERLQLKHRKHFSDAARELLLHLPWTGNVRELQNVMERVVQLVEGEVIEPDDLIQCLDFPPESLPEPVKAPPRRSRQSLTREDIMQALEHCHYNRTLAAAALGVSRKTFYRKMEELDITI